MNILETKDLCYSYEDNTSALKNINMKIKKGLVTAVLGGNGAGKSTLFLNLNGVLTPKTGEVYYDGKIVKYDKNGMKELRKKVGIIFQDPNDQLFSENVGNDIAFGALNMNYSNDEVSEMVKRIANETGVLELLDRPTHSLSFGQKKRVAIAGVLIMNPEVIILDEPTAGLDPQGVTEILKLLLKIKEERGTSIVISTHDIDIVPLYCDYAYIFNKGEKVEEGTPRELFLKPEKLRRNGLRISRIAHLMEMLNCKDGIPVDKGAGTVGTARRTLKEVMKWK